MKATKVVHRKLGREQAHGLAFKEEKEIHLDERLRKREYLETTIHELLHIYFPDLPERKVNAIAKKMSKDLWKLKFRRVDG